MKFLRLSFLRYFVITETQGSLKNKNKAILRILETTKLKKRTSDLITILFLSVEIISLISKENFEADILQSHNLDYILNFF